MSGEAYRDALLTARARVERLEATAQERGIQLVPDTKLSSQRIVAVGFAAVVMLAAGFGLRLAFDEARPPATFDVPVPVASPIAPASHALGWFEPARDGNNHPGPFLASTQGRRILIGMLWRRGEREKGLHVAAFDHDTLAVRWVAGPFESQWSSRDQDHRFHLRLEGETVVLADSAGPLRVLNLADGALVRAAVLEVPHREPKMTATPPVDRDAFIATSSTTRYMAYRKAPYRTDGPLMRVSATTIEGSQPLFDIGIPAYPTSRVRLVATAGDLFFVLVDDDMRAFDARTSAPRGSLEAP